MFANILDRDDSIGTLRHDPAGRDFHRLAGYEGDRRRLPGGDPASDAKLPRRVGCPHGIPIHGRAWKRGQVDHGPGRLREHSTRRALQRNHLGREWRDAA